MRNSRPSVLGSIFTLLVAFWARKSKAASGHIDLYLQNSQLDTNQARSAVNVAYYGAYTIGTPPRQFLGCFDTGSGDMWVPALTCTTRVCQSHDQYDPALSSTEQNTSRFPTEIQYGTGAVAVNLVYDNINIAGVSIENQGFGAATALTNDFSGTSCDGLVGMAFQSLSSLRALPPFLNAVREGKLDSNLFSVWLSPNPGVEPAGQLSLGTIDSSKYTGSLTYITITRQTYWQVPMNGIQVGGNSVSVSSNSAILDSGTTAIVMLTSDARAVNSQIPGAVYWADQLAWNVTCSISQLPDVTFLLGGNSFSVPPKLYVQLLTDNAGNSLDICVSAIVGGGTYDATGSAFTILGTNFLRAWFAVFSVAGTVGLAPAASISSTSTGGRKLLADGDEPPLFSRVVNTMAQHKWGPPSDSGGKRRLSQTEEALPQLFSRPASDSGAGKWGGADPE